jgi:hypothetical protein
MEGKEEQVMEAIDKMITLLRTGTDEPFMLYSDEVLKRLMKKIPLLQQTPEWSFV